MTIKTQGTLFQVATADGSAKTITGITQASPPVVSSTAHGLAAGTIIVISGIVGMTELNDRAFVVANPASGTFELKGIDATGYTAYVSGGSALPKTMTPVAKVTDGDQFNGEAPDVDVSHLRSTAVENIAGLQNFGTGSLQLLLVGTDAGQARCRYHKGRGTVGTFSITLTDGTVAAFQAYVKSFNAQIQRDNAVRGSISFTYATEPSWFA